jgi:hypothetical protein
VTVSEGPLYFKVKIDPVAFNVESTSLSAKWRFQELFKHTFQEPIV